MEVEVPSPPFRQGTKIPVAKVAFVLNAGGIGDYIHWVAGIRHAISSPHIDSIVVSPPYFADLAKLWFPRVHVTAGLEEDPIFETHAAVWPDRRQLANACGFHLTDLGFIYYNQTSPPKKRARLPEIRGDETPLDHFMLPQRYVVITTEATAENRRLPGVTVNRITSWLNEVGISPIFLGKRDVAPDHRASADPFVRAHNVIDLREKTSLTEAACIMARAQAVVGLDNGLLHLASCSKVPTVFLFTSVDPALRLPARTPGTITVSITPPESLSCRFCNSRMTHLIGHDFKNCLYRDNLCVTSISAEVIIKTLSQILTRGNTNESRI